MDYKNRRAGIRWNLICFVALVLVIAVFTVWHLLVAEEDEILFEQNSGIWDVVVTGDSNGIRQLRFGRKDVRQSQAKV